MVGKRGNLVFALLVFLCSLSALSPSYGQSVVSFKDARRDFPVGNAPSSIAVGDFNGDGRPDLAVANNSSNNISILLRTTSGIFITAQNLAVGFAPSSITVADFNSDSIADLAVANSSSNTVSVLFGNGDGTFGLRQELAVGLSPSFVIAWDLNDDGVPDLAVANHGSNTVSVLLGKGNGEFQSAMAFMVGIRPRSIAVGDFNGDDVLDLAVANAVADQYMNNVSILLGNGEGMFGPGQNFRSEGSPESITAADFDGDSVPDLAIANQISNQVSIFLGAGDGTFLRVQTRSWAAFPSPSRSTTSTATRSRIWPWPMKPIIMSPFCSDSEMARSDRLLTLW